MPLKDGLLPEFDHEMGMTRRVLERVPQADLAWKPHEKSFSLGELASHLAGIPTWIGATLDHDVFDVAESGMNTRPQTPESVAAMLKTFDVSVKDARTKIDAQTDQTLLAPWTFKNAGHELFTMPKASVLRTFIMNHTIHHRGQLTVYLRLRDVPVPALYGPTADEG